MHSLPHTDFDGAFTPGVVFLRGKDEWTMEVAKWGTLVTPTGRLLACEALSPRRVKPFKRFVEPGKYPVEIAWNGSETCAMRVRLSKRKSVRWEPALRVGEKQSRDHDERPPCFGVDSGMAGIYDLKAARIACRDEGWSSRVGEGGVHVHELDPKSKAGMVWCHSGYGDGGYASYWGFDRSGGITELVLDFLVLAEGVYDEHVVTNLSDKLDTQFDDPWFKQCGCADVRLSWSKRKGELRFEYMRAEPLEITFLNGRNKPLHRGLSGGGTPHDPHFAIREVDLQKDDRVKLVIRRYVGVRSLPRR